MKDDEDEKSDVSNWQLVIAIIQLIISIISLFK